MTSVWDGQEIFECGDEERVKGLAGKLRCLSLRPNAGGDFFGGVGGDQAIAPQVELCCRKLRGVEGNEHVFSQVGRVGPA
jgi:hypothetical protein